MEFIGLIGLLGLVGLFGFKGFIGLIGSRAQQDVCAPVPLAQACQALTQKSPQLGRRPRLSD